MITCGSGADGLITQQPELFDGYLDQQNMTHEFLVDPGQGHTTTPGSGAFTTSPSASSRMAAPPVRAERAGEPPGGWRQCRQQWRRGRWRPRRIEWLLPAGVAPWRGGRWHWRCGAGRLAAATGAGRRHDGRGRHDGSGRRRRRIGWRDGNRLGRQSGLVQRGRRPNRIGRSARRYGRCRWPGGTGGGGASTGDRQVAVAAPGETDSPAGCACALTREGAFSERTSVLFSLMMTAAAVVLRGARTRRRRKLVRG